MCLLMYLVRRESCCIVKAEENFFLDEQLQEKTHRQKVQSNNLILNLFHVCLKHVYIPSD